MNRERFRLMRRGALLINTARGGLVDTHALVWALDEGLGGGSWRGKSSSRKNANCLRRTFQKSG
jgi:hypothetical protein